ncbi:EH domain-containing and endocytosis protein 1 [Grifola frondosa]|uniref:EH domain-containing and endocytosis protein 1 n=1 Tax=Grifola frondosa TaxID=5627 RepID=A0A1C7MGC6_GRIFR|nr:EH domain-containing and endocytosis protein 1 [Grifola frondosa]
MSKFTPSPAEAALVNQILAQADPQKLGVITGEAAVKIFSGSKLSPTVLAEIWSLADDENNGVLTRKGIAVAVRLLGHAQRGERVSDALVNKPGPIPTIEGLTPPATQPSVAIPSTKSPPPGLPPLTAQDKAKFLKLFMGCNPTNGIISGDKARDVFVRSKLPVDKLSQIWTLADTKSRGSLDVTDFTIAMYLIQATMSGQLHAIPLSLPPALYEQAGGGVVAHATGGSGSFSPSLSGVFPNRPMSTIEPQFTGQNLAALQPQMTGQLRSAPSLPPRSAVGSSMSSFPFLQQQATGTASHWDVTAAEKASADRLFDGLDTQKKGYIEGDVAVPFMLQSGLPEDVLAQVWDLADLNNDGRLTRDGFAVAMHLIQRKLTGKDIPASLPPTLIPPSMRAAGAGSVAPSQPAVPEPIRDLLWDDSPPASATAPTHPPPTFSPQVTGSISPRPTPVLSSPPQRAQSVTFADTFTGSPFNVTAPAVVHRDLLGDDEVPAASSPPLHDQSAEIGNVKNQLSSTMRSLEASTSERASLERQLAEQAAQLSALQTQLSSAKAAYETETRLLATLRERFVAQTVDIQKAREELIRGESDLSAVRMEKSETEGSLLRDKEEVRELNRKMAEVGTQVEALKVDVEKAKKEAKQQKGLLAIAKKQLATRESERAKVEKELEEASIELQNATKEREDAEAELTKEVPATRTNGPERAMSPASEILAYAAMQPLPASPEASTPTSIISKSTNPFERLAMSSGSPPRSQSPFLPFSPVLSTSPIVPPAAAEPQAEIQEGPFGFSQAFGISHEELVTAALPAELETPKAVAQPTLSPQVSPAPPASATSEPEVLSPADTDIFITPPSTASVPRTP